jgi:hypothetical protein
MTMNNPMMGNPMQMLMQRFQQFRQTFSGNANQQIQQLMNSGKVNQTQYNQAVQMANQFKNMFGGMFGK